MVHPRVSLTVRRRRGGSIIRWGDGMLSLLYLFLFSGPNVISRRSVGLAGMAPTLEKRALFILFPQSLLLIYLAAVYIFVKWVLAGKERKQLD